jgi:DNA polymerase III subunit epsilon
MSINAPANTVVVFDFETTGMSPQRGDRSIEIGAVKLIDGKVVERFDRLMNPGIPIPWFIQNLTGISQAMLRDTAKNHQVMSDFFEFSKGFNLVAHNAAFDAKFLHAEFARLRKRFSGEIGCSLLGARRLVANAPSYKLASLIEYLCLPKATQYHRAYADAEACAHVWLYILRMLRQKHGVNNLTFGQLQQLNQLPKAKTSGLIRSWLA